MKKLLSTILAVAMLCAMAATAVFATETTGGEVVNPAFQYTPYASVSDLPTTSPGGGMTAIVIMKPSEETGGFSSLRFIFTHGLTLGDYGSTWGIGRVNPENPEGDISTWQFWDGAQHAESSTYNYGTSDTFFWQKDVNGATYFQNIMVLPYEVDEETGKKSWYCAANGETYESMYDLAAAGQLPAMVAEHMDGISGFGYADGLFNCDFGKFSLPQFGNSLNYQTNSGSPSSNGLDGIYLRVITEEEYYTYDENGEINGVQATRATIGNAVAHCEQGDLFTTNKNDGDVRPTGRISFIFKNGWVGNGLEVAWGVGLLPMEEGGNKPLVWNVNNVKWYNCDNGASVIARKDGVDTEITPKWADSEYFKWFTDANGDTVFQVVFQIPLDELQAHGYNTMEEAAIDGRLIGYIKDTVPGVNGVIDSKGDQQDLMANTVINDTDAILFNVVSGNVYYDEIYWEPEDESEPVDSEPADSEPADSKPADSKPTTEAPDDKKEGGCFGTVGAAALVLAAAMAAPVVFARKKH